MHWLADWPADAVETELEAVADASRAGLSRWHADASVLDRDIDRLAAHVAARRRIAPIGCRFAKSRVDQGSPSM